MSLTVSQIIQDVQFELDDTEIISASNPGLVFALRLINRGRQKILKESMCLTKTISFSTVEGQNNYSLPSNFFKVRTCDFSLNGILSTIYPTDLIGWNNIDKSASSTAYDKYYVDGGYIYFAPWVDSAPTVTLDGGINDSVTTIDVVSTVGFPTSGKVIIGSEVISYNDISDTELLYCVRGEEGTTAAAHLTGVTATLRNVQLTYVYTPSEVTTTSSTVETVFETYPDPLLYWICSQVKTRDTDDVQATGSNAQSSVFYQLYVDALNKMLWSLRDNIDIQNTVRKIRD